MKEKLKQIIKFAPLWYKMQPPLRLNYSSLKYWIVNILIDTVLASFPLWLWAIIIILATGAGLGAFLGIVHFSSGGLVISRSPLGPVNWCTTCHFDVTDKNPWHVPRILDAYSCTHCHARPFLNGAPGAVEHNVKKFYGLAKSVAQPELYPKPVSKPAEIDEQQCLSCHPDVWSLTPDVERYYSERLTAIGLLNTHTQHNRWRNFTPANQARLNTLTQKPGRNAEEEVELWTLEKIRKENCAQCHARTKRDPAGNLKEDKAINMASRDPLSCNACHLDTAAHLEDPATQAAFMPTEATCRRCHTGAWHGYKKLTRADQKEGVLKDCLACHPQYLATQISQAAP